MTKILPTIGPISEKDQDINYLAKKFNFIRLNGSHNTINWHSKVASKLKNQNKDIKVLIDIPGIKPRTLNKLPLLIKKNEQICFLYSKNKPITKVKIINISNPIPKISPKEKFFSISDGEFKFKIVKRNKHYVIGQSLNNFLLKQAKGVNFVNSIYDDKLQVKKYLAFIESCKNKIKFDSVGLSFIQNSNIIKIINKKYPKLSIISKIENLQGINNLHNIVEHSDCIMIDRGDLSAEIGEDRLFEGIQNIIKTAKQFGKPVIMATENLDSMITRKSPTKSEIVALGYAKSLGIDMIMLSDETATSNNWKNTINWLQNFLNQTDTYKKNQKIVNGYDFFWNFVREIRDIPLVIFTRKGFAINMAKSINPNLKLIVFTDNKRIHTSSLMNENTKCFLTNEFPKKNFNKFINSSLKKNVIDVFADNQELFLINPNILSAEPLKYSRANTLRVIEKANFLRD